MDDFKGMGNNADSQKLLPIVTALHHQAK